MVCSQHYDPEVSICVCTLYCMLIVYCMYVLVCVTVL